MRAHMSSIRSSRRDFCAHACQAVSLVSLASLLESCGGSPSSPSSNVPALPTINAAVSGGAVSVTVDAASPLSAVGNAALVQTGSGNFLVARTAQDAFTALTAICTHEQCTVNGFQNQRYVCPCHGSEYTTSGTVAKGPAVQSLRQFTTRFAGNIVTITIA
jgi:cytochrome b6-f complex iron-sulfur subunit